MKNKNNIKKQLLSKLLFDELERKATARTEGRMRPQIVIPYGICLPPFIMFNCLRGYVGKYEIYESFGWKWSMDHLKSIVGFNPANGFLISDDGEKLRKFIADKLNTTSDKITLCGTLNN